MPADRRRDWWQGLAVGALATLVAMLLQQGIRAAWQVRSLPERVMEALLVFVPLDFFEQGLQRFGANAKDIALLGSVAGMTLLIMLMGALAVRHRLNGWLLLLLGSTEWLLAMVLVMPLTGAGLFGTGLLVSPVLTGAGYLFVFGAYSVVLVFGSLLLDRVADGTEHRRTPAHYSPVRRNLLAGVVGGLATFTAYSLARAAAASGGTVQSSLPLAAAPTPKPVPTSVPTAVPGATSLTSGVTVVPPTPVATMASAATASPTASAVTFPTPAPMRSLARDQEGSLTAAGRAPGTLAPP